MSRHLIESRSQTLDGIVESALDFASDHPDAWRIYKFRFLNPEIRQKTIASLVGCSLSNVKRWLNCEPLAGRDFWDTPLIDED